MKKFIAVLMVAILSLSLVGCGKQETAPPRELWYLGGASILDGFEVTACASEGSGDIVLFIPFDFVAEGFRASTVQDSKEEQVNLLKDVTFSPGSYYAIPEEAYQGMDTLYLHLEYSWEGTTLSQRWIDLFTGEELVPTNS